MSKNDATALVDRINTLIKLTNCSYLEAFGALAIAKENILMKYREECNDDDDDDNGSNENFHIDPDFD